MAKLTIYCPYCKKPADIVNESRIEAFGQILKTYACGHTVCEAIVNKVDYAKDGYKLVCADCLAVRSENEDFSAHLEHTLVEIPVDRNLMFAKLREFQRSGVEFIERANYNCAILDEMGLGKTVQACSAVYHAKEQLSTVFFVVKSSLKFNWAKEMVVAGWLCEKDNPADYPFIVMDGTAAVIPGFRYYIISHSMLPKLVIWGGKGGKEVIGLKPEIAALGLKTLVIDESQAFSNPSTKRTRALLGLASVAEYHICLSGSPINNRASEYWPTLNMIKPDHWREFKVFRDNWVKTERTEAGGIRFTGLKEWRRDEFFRKTAPYILRRRKRDVMKELPAFTRTFEIVDVSDSELKVNYNKTAQELEDFIMTGKHVQITPGEKSSRILGFLMRMRHLTGVMKAQAAVEYIMEFLDSTEDENSKIIVGIHHDDVMRQLQLMLSAWNPVVLTGGMDDETRARRIEEFRTAERRICLAKILASGEGTNGLQCCQDMLVLERQWNATKEEQFEARIDRYGQTGKTHAAYLIAKNTVDEIYTQMVEEKRKDCGEAVDRDYNFEADAAVLQLLGERAAKLRV